MAFLKNITVANGTTLGYHRVVGLEVNYASNISTVRINSWVSEEDFLLGRPNVWSQNITEPNIARYNDEISSMILESSDFSGSVIVEDIEELDKLRLQKILKLKHSRDLLERAGFSCLGKEFDSDLVSQSRIQGGVIRALIMLQEQDASPIYWTLKDNSITSLSASEMLVVGKAAYEHVQSTHGLYRAAKVRVMQATTAEEIEGVQLNA